MMLCYGMEATKLSVVGFEAVENDYVKIQWVPVPQSAQRTKLQLLRTRTTNYTTTKLPSIAVRLHMTITWRGAVCMQRGW